MPCYDYFCAKCDLVDEVSHSIHKDPTIRCSECKTQMKRIVTGGAYIISGGTKDTLEDHREKEHQKKVKDPERAVKSRKKAFGHDAVGDPSMQSDPRHVVRRGRTLGGQQKEVDKREFIKAAAKDEGMVRAAQESLKKAAG